MTKPTIRFISAGDMYGLNRIAVAALRKANLHNLALELEERGMNAQSFHEMLNLVLEYVDVEQESCRGA